jgi:hypothetical protein
MSLNFTFSSKNFVLVFEFFILYLPVLRWLAEIPKFMKRSGTLRKLGITQSPQAPPQLWSKLGLTRLA